MTDLSERFARLADHALPQTSAATVFARAQESAMGARRRRAQWRASALSAAVLAVVAIVVLVLAEPAGRHGLRVATTGAPTTAPSAAPEYEVDATVVQLGSASPHLCLEPVLVAAPGFVPLHPSATAGPTPPGCDGPAVAGWDWSTVRAKVVTPTATWGDFHVVGTYAGSTLTITRPPRPTTAPGPTAPTITLPGATPCAAPPGGWVVRDPSKIALSNFLAVQNVANTGQADFSTLWWDRTTAVDGSVHGSGDFPHEILAVAFTGSLAAHRAEIQAVWGGPLCVFRHAHSAHDLGHVVEAIDGATGRTLGFAVLDAERDDVGDRVVVSTVIATPAMQATVDRAFGAGVVHLVPRMRIVAP